MSSKHEQLKQQVIQLARYRGFEHIYHTWNSMHSPAGFPDLMLLQDGRLIVAELKIRPDNLKPEQYDWLIAFRLITEFVFVWDDSEKDWEQIQAVLELNK